MDITKFDWECKGWKIVPVLKWFIARKPGWDPLWFHISDIPGLAGADYDGSYFFTFLNKALP